MDILNKTNAEFKETDMRKIFKECQRARMAYQQEDPYIEGYNVWHENNDGKSWCGPASVHYQKGRSVWIYSMGEMKKVAACKVKLYGLVHRDQGDLSVDGACKGGTANTLNDDTENVQLVNKTQDQ